MCLDEFHWANNRYRYTILYKERERERESCMLRDLCLPLPINSLNCREIIIKQSLVMRMLPPQSPPLSTHTHIHTFDTSIIVKYSEQFHVRLRIWECVLNVTHKFNGIICWNRYQNLCTQSSQSSQGIAYSIEHRLVRGSQGGNFKSTLHFWKLDKWRKCCIEYLF